MSNRYASKQEELYHIILENLPEGVNVVDTEGYIIYANISSGKYANADPAVMVGKHVTVYFPKAALIDVLRTRNSVYDLKTEHGNGRTFIVTAFPLYLNSHFSGGVASFRDITEIEELSKRLEFLEMELAFTQADDIVETFVGKEHSLKAILNKALRSVASIGGPRHSIILGETGTGKTMLAKAMYFFAKKSGVIKEDAPFIEVNCAQFTNPDIAAMEIFGTVKGAFTGAAEKPGLVELANGGVLFLDEAHALVHHQTMLLKLIESGMVRRIGGRNDLDLKVIVIAASSKDLKKELLPELYQRLAQYQMDLPPLRNRTLTEKKEFLNYFVNLYCDHVHRRYGFNFRVTFSEQAEALLMNARYERNVRQFRDVINASIDAVAPLINSLPGGKKDITVIVEEHHVACHLLENNTFDDDYYTEQDTLADLLIKDLTHKGLGARKIAMEMKKRGYDLEYYHIAYKQKKLKKQALLPE